MIFFFPFLFFCFFENEKMENKQKLSFNIIDELTLQALKKQKEKDS